MRALSDWKYALRSLAKHPGFTFVAVISLALGIGANATIFTLLNAILLRPLPLDNASTLAAVYTVDPRNPGYLGCSFLNFKDYRDRNSVFSALALYSPITVNLTGQGDPRLVMAHMVTANYFSTLGVKPLVGRTFLPEEDVTPNANAVAVISYGLWNRLFAADPHITSRSLVINGRAFAIVGVAPPSFQGINQLYGADLWVPSMMYPQVFPSVAWINQRRASVFSVVGRLKPGVGMPQAEGAMQSLAAELARQYPKENNGRSLKLAPISEAALSHKDRDIYNRTGVILLCISGLVLLIACANVASLQLVRAAARSREITVRLALGASRWQLVRQLLLESVLLSACGGALGVLLAQAAGAVLWSIRPPAFKYAGFQFDLDLRILGYTFAIALFTGVFFGLIPALRATRADLANDLKERGGQPSSAGGKWGPRSFLVMGQLAFSLIALIGAGLFVRSVINANQVDPGFDAAHLGIITFNVANQGYNEARGRDYEQRILEKAASVPGVEAVTLSKDPPFNIVGSRTVLLQGQDNTASGVGRATLTSVTWPGYFQAVRIPVLRGRDFTLQDSKTSPRIAIVNQAAATHFWPGQEAVGRVIEFAGENLPVQIVGVVRNANYQVIGELPQAMVYLAMPQYYFAYSVLYIRTARDSENATAAILANVRRQAQTIDPNLFLDPETVRTTIQKTLWVQSLSAVLLSVFGGLALLLATIGIYGVVSYSVTLRGRELGVRIALGATPVDVQGMILRDGLRLVILGITAGAILSLLVTRWLESMLLMVSARDAQTFLAVPAILAVAAIVACWIPARRATKIDPAIALRE
jgi:predicted permease